MNFDIELKKTSSDTKTASHYTVNRVKDEDGLDFLKFVNETTGINDSNFVLFSTSGIHGSYITLDELEKGYELRQLGVTFVLVQPRKVTMFYGNALPERKEDFEFLKMVRDQSIQAVSKIGF